MRVNHGCKQARSAAAQHICARRVKSRMGENQSYNLSLCQSEGFHTDGNGLKTTYCVDETESCTSMSALNPKHTQQQHLPHRDAVCVWNC